MKGRDLGFGALGADLDRLNKPTQRPTTETALIPLPSLTAVHGTMAGVSLGRKLKAMTGEARTVLQMLKAPESVLTTPPVRNPPGRRRHPRRPARSARAVPVRTAPGALFYGVGGFAWSAGTSLYTASCSVIMNCTRRFRALLAFVSFGTAGWVSP